MKCKKVHTKMIFFLEGGLPEQEMKQVQKHIDSCVECAGFAEEMKKMLSVLDRDKVAEVNPFFYTRVKAKLENKEEEVVVGQPVFARILQPVVFSAMLLLGVYGGIRLGQPAGTPITDNTMARQELFPYLNGMDAEPIETFLMEQENGN